MMRHTKMGSGPMTSVSSGLIPGVVIDVRLLLRLVIVFLRFVDGVVKVRFRLLRTVVCPSDEDEFLGVVVTLVDRWSFRVVLKHKIIQ